MVYKAKRYVYKQEFGDMPKQEDLELVEEDLPELKNGEFLAEAVFLSVDPYMKSFSPRFTIGMTMIGSQVAKIIESKNENFPVGKHVVGHFGWRTLTISDGGKSADLIQTAPFLVPDETVPLPLYLGILGMPGNTAYFAFLEICKPKAGETVIVTAAAGAVGSQVGQIAKIKGCKVIGVTGSDEKFEYLQSLGFDEFINYKKGDLDEAVKKAAPEGIDCYFDNVGGEISSTILQHMNSFGRVAVVGSITAYTYPGGRPKATIVQPALIRNQIEMRGFTVLALHHRQMEGIHQNLEWCLEGKMKCRQTITNGFENMMSAFVGVLNGRNVGKAVVRV